jgi:hypothetical protein
MCFVNESVNISGLEMSKNTRLTIPVGVSVKIIASFYLHNVTIDDGGDFYASGGGDDCSNSLDAALQRWNRGEGSALTFRLTSVDSR